MERQPNMGSTTYQTIPATHASASAARAKKFAWKRTRIHQAATLVSCRDGKTSAMTNRHTTITKGITRIRTAAAVYLGPVGPDLVGADLQVGPPYSPPI